MHEVTLMLVKEQIRRLGCRFVDLGPFDAVACARREGEILVFDTCRTEFLSPAAMDRLAKLPDGAGPGYFWGAVIES
jgi:hypothetical protein